MKNLTIALAVLTSLNLQAQDNQVIWATSSFWQAPQITKTNVKVKLIEGELINVCSKYKNLVYNADGELNFPDGAEQIGRFRSTPISFNQAKFKASYLLTGPIDANGLKEIESDLSSQIKVNEETEQLPFYTQLKSFTQVKLATTSDLSITALPGSYTAVSRQLGLTDSKVSIARNSKSELVLVIEGKDVACDLLEGKIQLQGKANSLIEPKLEGLSMLMDFYHDEVDGELNKVLSSSDAPIIKAARLGYRLGAILEKKSPSTNVSEKQLKNFMAKIFKENSLEPTADLTTNDAKKSVLVRPFINGADVSVNFSL